MKCKTLLPLIICVYLICPTIVAAQAINTQDSLALVNLYDSTNGHNWANQNGWLTKAPVSTWYGVTVSNGRVARLILDENNLSGNIPHTIGSLTAVTFLSLNQNVLTGSLPAELGNLAKVSVLYIAFNQLTGSLPVELGNLSAVTDLEFENNNLTGSIPASLGNLSNLTILELWSNQLSGSIPSQLGNLANLTTLDFNTNLLSDSIPSALGNLKGLTTLYLFANQLSGSIPSTFGNLGNLQDLRLYSNRLTGNIPSSLGQLKNLGGIYLANNQLTGSIPSSIGNLSLSVLDIANNQLSGTVPSTLANITNLQVLFINNNALTFNGLENLPKAYYLKYSPQATISLIKNGATLSVSAGGTPANDTFRLYQNGVLLKTQIADSVFSVPSIGKYYITATNAKATQLTLYSDTVNLSVSLQDSLALVDLYDSTKGSNWVKNTNWLTGVSVSKWYGVTVEGGRVKLLILSFNRLTGKIPYSLGSLDGLDTLDLSGNQINGGIPSTFGNLTNLKELILATNELSGTIPSSLGNLIGLENLSLGSNQLGGNIPSTLGNLTNLFFLDLSYNKLVGVVPYTFGILDKLSQLYLNSNQLSGSIPLLASSLGNNFDTGFLLLQNNNFIFNGMENLPKALLLVYAPQAIIPLIKNNETLSVSAGGTPANDTFRLYLNNILLKTQVADSVFAITTTGKYYITATNAKATQLTLYTDTLDITSLPLTLLNFTGTANHGGNLLQWQTTEEINTKSFGVERSSDAISFIPIDTVNAVNMPGINNYSFTDANPQAGINYYRLKMMDKDGLFTYSKTIALKTGDAKFTLSIYPNPTSNIAVLSFGGYAGNQYSITVTDIAGKTIKRINSTTSAGVNTVQLDMQDFASSIYLITLVDADGSHSIKLAKQ